MTLDYYLTTRGLVPTKLNECTIKDTIYSLYAVVDELYLSKKPEHLQSALVRSYTYYCIFLQDLRSSELKAIHSYLSEEEAIALYMELTNNIENNLFTNANKKPEYHHSFS